MASILVRGISETDALFRYIVSGAYPKSSAKSFAVAGEEVWPKLIIMSKTLTTFVDKNHDDYDPPASLSPESLIQKLADQGSLSIILCASPIRKTRFLGMLADLSPGPVSYVDTDLLYAGCTRAGLYKGRGHITLICPDQKTWRRDLAGLISAASSERTTVIIDSLNGIYEMFGGPDSAMSANSQIMALASLARQAGSSVVVGAMVRRKKGQRRGDAAARSATDAEAAVEWSTHPGGRQIPRMAESYLLGGTTAYPSLARVVA